ncbi:hypothetical protein ACQP2P_14905 [Dactylosporangium sp. CA-139114]|uniref:hypothetical protein n=1 Tax=Dactylosporangium sp. CA-139114 TaxID=3239931 RepID=UPI003D9630A6
MLAGTQVLRMAVPQYCQDDPALARVVDEEADGVFLAGLGGRTVAQALRERGRDLAVVAVDATVLELAALMGPHRYPARRRRRPAAAPPATS